MSELQQYILDLPRILDIESRIVDATMGEYFNYLNFSDFVLAESIDIFNKKKKKSKR
jgi:hypothetical protein